MLLTTEDGPRPDTVRIAVQRERLTGPERMLDAKAELQGLLAGLGRGQALGSGRCLHVVPGSLPPSR